MSLSAKQPLPPWEAMSEVMIEQMQDDVAALVRTAMEEVSANCIELIVKWIRSMRELMLSELAQSAPDIGQPPCREPAEGPNLDVRSLRQALAVTPPLESPRSEASDATWCKVQLPEPRGILGRGLLPGAAGASRARREGPGGSPGPAREPHGWPARPHREPDDPLHSGAAALPEEVPGPAARLAEPALEDLCHEPEVPSASASGLRASDSAEHGTDTSSSTESSADAGEQAHEDGEPGAAVPAHTEQVWRVVGGQSTGGILVRSRKDIESPLLRDRLATGALVSRLALENGRLSYSLVAGTGPMSGWVSIKVSDRTLMRLTRMTIPRVLEELGWPCQTSSIRSVSGVPTHTPTYFMAWHNVGEAAGWWEDVVEINTSFRFRRLTGNDTGSWAVHGRSLYLCWDSWPCEVLWTRSEGRSFTTHGGEFELVLGRRNLKPGWFLDLFGAASTEYASIDSR